MNRFLATLCFVLLTTAHGRSKDGDAGRAAAAPKVPLALTSSGAVSLGSYQAGYHYYAVEFLKLNKHLFDVKVVTGASAGAINALLTVMALADTTCVVDTQSVFYRAWLPIGIKQLMGSTNPLGIVNRDSMDAIEDPMIEDQLRGIAEKGTPARLDLVLAVTGTKTRPYLERLGNLAIPRVKDRFVIKVDKEPGKALRLRNYCYQDLNVSQTILPFGAIPDKDILKGIVYSSSAFPGAFAPYDKLPMRAVNTAVINDRLSEPIDWGTPALWKRLSRIPEADSIHPAYLDGGIFDNEPIRLAHMLATHGLRRKQGEVRWKRSLNRRRTAIADSSMMYAYLSPGNTRYPQLGTDDSAAAASLPGLFLKAGPAMIAASRRNELFTLLEENDKLGERMFLTENHAVPMSGYMGNFFGFLERDFRMFDFYLGMYDAERNLRQITRPGSYLRRTVGKREVHFPAITYYWPGDEQPEKAGFLARTLLGRQYKQGPAQQAVQQRYVERKAAPVPGTGIEPLKVRGEHLLLKSVLDSIYVRVETTEEAPSRLPAIRPDSTLLMRCDRNFVVLLQTSVDRLWARWLCAVTNRGSVHAVGGTYDSLTENMWREKLTVDSLPPRVVAGNDTIRYRRRFAHVADLTGRGSEEDALIYLLQEYRFSYRSVGSGPLSGDQLAQAMLKGFSYFTFNGIRNTPMESNLVKYVLLPTGAQRALDQYYYLPKLVNFFGTYRAGSGEGGWELGFAPRLFRIPAGQSRLLSRLHLSAAYFGSHQALYGTAGLDFSLYSIDRTAEFAWYNPARFLYSGPILQPTITAALLYGNRRGRDVGGRGLVGCTGVALGYTVSLFELLQFGLGYERYVRTRDVSFGSWDELRESGAVFRDEGNHRFLFKAGIMLTSRDFTWLGTLRR